MDENEKVYDYHGGIADIENRVIRHINSQAFVEDPLRVFRAARFFTQLGFEIHPSTMKLMVGMSKSGMLSELSPDRVWKETVKVLSSEWPSRYFYLLHEIGALDYWFSELKALYGVPQRADHHPECDTFLHTMMALDTCAALTKDPVTRWSLICHDLGKALTDPGKWPQHFKHESLGIKSCNSLCERLGVPNEYRDMALLVTELHIKCHRIMESKPGTIVGLLDRLGVKHGVENLFRFTTACLADARGRRGKGNRRYRDGSFLHSAALVYLSVKPRKDVVGSKVGESLYMDRAQAISKFKNRYAMTD
jgi:tRNA nucleotidyltransferase (CCA-adding enzyme)